jgi:hypothetical protein
LRGGSCAHRGRRRWKVGVRSLVGGGIGGYEHVIGEDNGVEEELEGVENVDDTGLSPGFLRTRDAEAFWESVD